MRSLITKVGTGLAAAALALGGAAAPAFAAASSAAAASGDTAIDRSAGGHWQYVTTLSERSCLNAVNKYALDGIEARCEASGSSSALYIWVAD